MANHLYLPEEVLQIIVWQLKLSLGFGNSVKDENRVLRKTLVSCLLSNRTLYRLTKPVLYHTINMDNLTMVMQHFAQYPTLADQVRELSVIQADCRENFEIIDEYGDIEWPEYVRSRMSAHPSLLDSTDQPDCNVYLMAPAMLALILCTRIHTLVLEASDYVEPILDEEFLKECIAFSRAQTDVACVPLASLRKIDFQKHDSWGGHKDEPDKDWFSYLLRLPQIESLRLGEIHRDSRFEDMGPSGLKSLTLTEAGELPASMLGIVLKGCPMLECLDVKLWPSFESYETCFINWGEIGIALSLHGSKLRKIRLDSPGDHSPLLAAHVNLINIISLASLSHLTSLSLPIEAVLCEPAGEYIVPATEPDDDSDNSGHADLHDEAPEDDDDDDEDEYQALHAPGKGLNTPTTPLSQILPQSLRHFRIIDGWNCWADAVLLDIQLRAVMLLPQFSELRTIRVRRKIPYTKHVKNLGWRDKRREHFWNVLLRY